ncbi:FAD-binding protein [Tamilnaduibacter salinus]|uniref:FAD-binding protein n=1 Tax=Tamilnaduibacter salinus TaxID=1484056 RepID=A0A2A2I228_9GAMM|nr:D-arabinono-1,4-lactone oxidase [Tamilnaduibacter salinus]PAV25053.1 FAD-binding protein [Tamilnaduibacter salinus]
MSSRRDFLQMLLAASATPWLPDVSAATTTNTDGEPMAWYNWSGALKAKPRHRAAPKTIEALQALVRDSRDTIRPVGSSHSFAPLVPTDGTLVSLSHFNGLQSVDEPQMRATIGAGTRLEQIGQPLADAGQALVNMPDIDEQSLAGTIATATHGTGAGLPCLSDQVTALTLVDGRGEVHRCSADHNRDLFDAARVGLGALGLVTSVTLQNRRPYRLRRVTEWHPIEAILDQAEQMADRHRNFEFFYIPFSGMGFMDWQDITEEPLSSTESLDQNEGARTLRTVRDMLGWSPRLRELALGTYMKTIDRSERVAPAWRNYASSRQVRFNEMEYHLPREAGLPALRAVRRKVEKDFPDVFFPFEVRYVKGDDAWLSPFYRQDSMSIAVHRVHDEPHDALFRAVEPILRQHGGRPHWGKMHSLTAAEARALYPRWEDFQAVRRTMDPEGRFLNEHLRRLFAEGTS